MLFTYFTCISFHPYFYHDAFMPHPMHVLDAPVVGQHIGTNKLRANLSSHAICIFLISSFQNYLRSFGYVDENPELELDARALRAAVEKFQTMASLPVTGIGLIIAFLGHAALVLLCSNMILQKKLSLVSIS